MKKYAVIINDGNTYSAWGVFNSKKIAIAHLENAVRQGYTGHIEIQ